MLNMRIFSEIIPAGSAAAGMAMLSLAVDGKVLEFVRDFALIVFVYAMWYMPVAANHFTLFIVQP